MKPCPPPKKKRKKKKKKESDKQKTKLKYRNSLVGYSWVFALFEPWFEWSATFDWPKLLTGTIVGYSLFTPPLVTVHEVQRNLEAELKICKKADLG